MDTLFSVNFLPARNSVNRRDRRDSEDFRRAGLGQIVAIGGFFVNLGGFSPITG